MKKLTLMTLVAVMLLSAGAMAFDGNRKGFVLGGGIGFAPTIKVEVEDDGDWNNAGVSAHIVIGYAWDEKNMLVYESNGAAFEETMFGEDVMFSQSIGAASWYHYFGESGKTFYTVVGLGLMVGDTDETDATDPGAGILLGGGYEFSRHWQVGLYLASGKSSVGDAFWGDTDLTHTTLSLLVSGIAF